MIKAVLFDVDNTLLDFDAYVRESIKNGFREFGLGDYDDTMFDTFTEINNRLWRQIEQGSITYSALYANRWNLIFEALGVSFDGERFETYFREQLFDNAIPIDGAIKILRYLEGRYLLYVASNGPYEQQLHRLETGGLAPYLTHSFISENVGAEKPSRQFFDVCMERLRGRDVSEEKEILIEESPAADKDLSQLRPEEVMMIGDSLTADMGGGIAYGMKTCWYDRDGKGLPQGMAVDHVVRSLGEIRDIL